MDNNLPIRLATRQKGVVLTVSLIMLLIMTVIGLASMQSTTLEEKMAGNYRDQNLSFQAAESTLREGETWIGTRTEEPPLAAAACNPQCDVWDVNTLLPALGASSYVDVWSTDTGTGTNPPQARTATATIPGVAESPKFFLEFQKYKRDRLNVGQQGDSSVRTYYGVVTQGYGGRASTRTVLQSSYTRRF